MILTGPEIQSKVLSGDIIIDPFDPALVNPNSYNYRLGRSLLVPDDHDFDCHSTPSWTEIEIPQEGFLIEPHNLYLAHTYEHIGSDRYVTSLIGRSSLGRLGLFVQITADLGNLGPAHSWTLELHSVQPVRVFPYIRLGQVSFWQPMGRKIRYTGTYTDHSMPAPNKPLSYRISTANPRSPIFTDPKPESKS